MSGFGQISCVVKYPPSQLSETVQGPSCSPWGSALSPPHLDQTACLLVLKRLWGKCVFLQMSRTWSLLSSAL